MATRKTKGRKKKAERPLRRRVDGGLPAKLLAATEEILREQGLHKFTLREAARRAGVSHGAPAFHFGDASGLLTAFAAEGYDGMTALMLKYRAEAPKDAAAQLVAVGCAYIDYAIAHRPQFQLMFRSDVIHLDDKRYCETSERTFAQLQETMAPYLGPGVGEAEQMAKLMLAWSSVHGFATLYLEKGFHPFYGDDPRPPVSADAKRMLEILNPAFSK